MGIEALINQNILKLSPYNPEREKLPIMLDIMENPYNLPSIIKKGIKKRLDKIRFNRYPDPDAGLLRQRLEVYTGVSKDMILVGNGSDELVLYILLTFGGISKRVIYPFPTFPMYEIIGKITGCETIRIPLLPDFEIDSSKIINEAKGGKSIIFIAYPNNPTGNCFKKEGIEEIIKETGAIVVIDEAYFEFSKKTLVDLLSRYDRLAIIRTFSKGFGLAGLRCGYILANPPFINCLKRVKLPYNVNTLSQEIACILIEELNVISSIIDKIIRQREWLYKRLSSINGIKAYPSSCNFILFKVENPERLYSYLVKGGILIKKLGDYLRVTIGTPKENRLFIELIKTWSRL